MTVASILIEDALQLIGVSSAIMPSEPDQQVRAFRVLQRLYDILPEENIYLDMQRPATVQSNIREPGYATEPLVHILAKWVAPYFKADATFVPFKESMNFLRRKTGRTASTKYPAGVPIGSGNTAHGFNLLHFYVGDNPYQFMLFDEAKVGESKVYTADFTAEASRRNTTVASVAWANVTGEVVAISNETLTGSIAKAQFTYSSPGNSEIRARCTFADTQVYDAFFKIHVVDPRGRWVDADHG